MKNPRKVRLPPLKGPFPAVMALGSMRNLVPWPADRWIVRRWAPWAETLVFPTIRTLPEMVGATGGLYIVSGALAAPAAGMGSLPYIVRLGGFSLFGFVLPGLPSAAMFWIQIHVGSSCRTWTSLDPFLVVLFLNLALVAGEQRCSTPVRVRALAMPLALADDRPLWLDILEVGRVSQDQETPIRALLLESTTKTLGPKDHAAGQGAKIDSAAEGNIEAIDFDLPSVREFATQKARHRRIWISLGVHEYLQAMCPLVIDPNLVTSEGLIVPRHDKVHSIREEVSDWWLEAKFPVR